LETVRRARAFIAPSEFGKSEICTVFRLDPARVTTIHHGIDEAFSPGDPGMLPEGLEPNSYLLFVGDPGEPRKNFSMLRNAHRTAWPNAGGPRLHVVSRMGDDTRGDAEGLISLYRGALAVTVPSYHETFGFPLLEAMACGVPALASQISSLPEVGDDAALWLPPHDEAAWRDALRCIADDVSLREQRRERGLARATAFHWDTSALAHLELFRRVAEEA
jgi:glycosyltransferase involved in cell wall biosynthesis